MQQTRLIMYHKQDTSARLRFLKLAYGGVCGFAPLPTLAQLIDGCPSDTAGRLALHPAPLLMQARQILGLGVDDLEAVAEFREMVDVPDGPVQVFLARFTTIDPPFNHAHSQGAQFIELPQARDLPQVELELLRAVYTLVIGG